MLLSVDDDTNKIDLARMRLVFALIERYVVARLQGVAPKKAELFLRREVPGENGAK